ncbi:MAG TPA: DNA-binding domain-containing protein [Steroidobacteraceae bacterium]|nr:DNA-binding domain-containing protein [Steroidobacteraceae bacterium]
MLSLPELQKAFSAAILFDETGTIEPYVVHKGVEPAGRLRLYRNNARENFLAALRAAFPVLERLVGADYFRQLALQYMQRFPSPSGNLHDVGERLPTYLQRRFARTEYAYFPDVARLERACQEVLVAEEHPPLDLQRLAAVEPEECGRLCFALHPAVRLVASAFPVLRIWCANQPDGDADHVIDLRQGGEQVLVQRTRETVEMSALSATDFAFLTAIAAGETLTTATVTAAGRAATEFDVGHALRRHVSAGVIVDFHLGADR